MKALPETYRLLAVESSAGPASCALLSVEAHRQTVLCSAAVNTCLTHSQTLLPMAEDMLKNAGLSFADVDALAVAVGPGSFTGVRIGVAAVKGLAFAADLPCVPVSTLEGMAYRFAGLPMTCDIVAVMDARRRQVYTALFSLDNGVLTRVTPDEALSLDTLASRLAARSRTVLAVGDGAEWCCRELAATVVPSLQVAPVGLAYQHAIGVARAAVPLLATGQAVSGERLLPLYLRLPQAERELRRRQAEQKIHTE